MRTGNVAKLVKHLFDLAPSVYQSVLFCLWQVHQEKHYFIL